MTINLNGINVTKLNPQAERAEQTSNEAKSSAQPSSEQQGDNVRLSENASSIERLQQEIRQVDTFDHKRVEAISLAISEGRYPVDPQRIAQQFLELESQLY